MTGKAQVVYPTLITKIRENVTPSEEDIISVKKDLGTIITFAPDDFQKRVGWLDIAFDIPSDMEAILLQFKQNAVIELPKSVTSTDEIERQLNSSENPAPSQAESSPNT